MEKTKKHSRLNLISVIYSGFILAGVSTIFYLGYKGYEQQREKEAILRSYQEQEKMLHDTLKYGHDYQALIKAAEDFDQGVTALKIKNSSGRVTVDTLVSEVDIYSSSNIREGYIIEWYDFESYETYNTYYQIWVAKDQIVSTKKLSKEEAVKELKQRNDN